MTGETKTVSLSLEAVADTSDHASQLSILKYNYLNPDLTASIAD